MEVHYEEYANLESYLLEKVRPHFLKNGYLSAADFFCIIIWKANRAKSKIAKKLLVHGHEYEDLNKAVHELTSGLHRQPSPKDRLRFLWDDWKIGLPMASAILAILYPDEFTVYDKRVCSVLQKEVEDFRDLLYQKNFEELWRRYQEFKYAVEKSTPTDMRTLRDKDHYLWGKSFYKELIQDIERGFQNQESA